MAGFLDRIDAEGLWGEYRSLVMVTNSIVKRLALTSVVALMALLPLKAAQACSCFFPDDYGYDDAFADADQVMIGTVEVSIPWEDRRYYGIRSRVNLKGCEEERSALVWVSTGRDDGVCGVDLTQGETYLLHMDSGAASGELSIDSCGYQRAIDQVPGEDLSYAFSQTASCE